MSKLDFGFSDIEGIPDKFQISGSINTGIRAKISNQGSSNVKNLVTGLKGSPEELVIVLDGILREAINANIWRTRSGVDDIIDSGNLLKSQNISYSGSSINISYDVPYASLIHYGGYIIPYGNSGLRPVYVPPRPWVFNVLNDLYGGFSLAETYSDIIRRILSKF